MQLQGKQVLLSGATGGIGSEIAKLLAAQGATLHLVGRNSDTLAKLSKQLSAAAACYPLVADIGTEEGRKKVAEHCLAQTEGIHLLINCAGINEFGLFHTLPEKAIVQLINVNITAPLLLTRQLLPTLQKNGPSQIVNVGSTFGSIGYPGFATYSATKFALRGFSEALRRELADTDIRVSYIAPRATKTAINNEQVVAMNHELGVAMDDPIKVANAVIKVILKRQGGNTFLGWPEKLFVRINALLPALVDNALFKQLPIIRRYAAHAH